LVVEIADSSLRDDRAMVSVYGPAGISAYRIVNLVDRRIEVYTAPGPGGYAGDAIYRPA
jgi:Uma2 family endonuclease